MEHNPFIGFGLVLIIVLLFGSTFAGLIYSLASTLAGL
jgi:hypothetical protein